MSRKKTPARTGRDVEGDPEGVRHTLLSVTAPARGGSTWGGVGVRVLFALAAACCLGPAGFAAVEENRLSFRAQLESVDVAAIPASGARFSCFVPLAHWRDFSSDFRNRSPRGVKVEQAVKSHLDPRAEVFLDPSLLEHTTAFGMSIWPPIELRGAKSPVWLMGFLLDDIEAAEAMFDNLLARLNRPGGLPVIRTFNGVRIHSIETIYKDLHLVQVGSVLLTASNLAALTDFLRTQSEEPAVPPSPDPPLSIEWNLVSESSPPPPAAGGLIRTLLRMGINRVAVGCERLDPGYRLFIVLDTALEIPPPPGALEFDESLIDHLPENSDFVLWGARSPVEMESILPGFPPLPVLGQDRISRSLAFGLGIPDSTDSVVQAVRISGAYTKPPPPIPPELIPEEIRAATLTHPSEAEDRQVLKLGDLELALIDRGDRSIFRNAPSADLGPGLRNHLRNLAQTDANLRTPVFVGLASPRLLTRPVDLEYEARKRGDEVSLLNLWPPFRSMVHPVDLSVFLLEPGKMEVELVSTSFLSTVLVVLHTANFLHLLEKGETEPLSNWLGEMGPLPER